MTNERIVTEIVVDARGARAGTEEYRAALEVAQRAVDRFTASQERRRQADRESAATASQSAQQLEATARSYSSAERSLNAYLAKLDPVFAAQTALRSELTQANSALAVLDRQVLRNATSLAEFSTQSKMIKTRQQELREALQGVTTGTLSAEQAMATLSTRASQGVAPAMNQASYATRQFGLQFADIVSGLATGQPVFTTFVQQGQQIASVSIATGVGMGTLAKSVAGVVASFAPLIGAIAVVGGIVALGAAAETSARQIEGLQNSLRATRTDFQSLAVDVQATAKIIAATTGIGTSDARQAGGILAGVAGFAGGREQLADLIRTANDFAKVMGVTVPDAAKEMANAMQQPGRAAQELADKHFPGMSQSLAYSIKLMADGGDKAGAFGRYMEIVRAQTKGAAENLTPLQKSIEALSKAFTSTGQDGRSLADTIGSYITSAVAAAVDQITSLVGILNKLRGIGAPDSQPSKTGMLGGDSVIVNDDAVGLFQLRRKAAADVGMSPDMRYSYQANILGGVTYFRQQLDRANGDIDFATRAYNQGFAGATAGGGASYLSSVVGRDVSALSPQIQQDIATAIVQAFSDYTRQADIPRIFERVAQIALQETGGQHFGTPNPTIPSMQIPAISPVSLNMSLGALSNAPSLRDQAFAAAIGIGGLSTQREQNLAQQNLLRQGLASTSDPAEIAKISEAIAKLRGEESELITEQEKLARSAADATRALSAQAGYARTMAEIDQQFAEAARRSGLAVDEKAKAIAKAAAATRLSVEYSDIVESANREVDAQKRIMAAYDGTAQSIERATNLEKAYAQARKNFDENSPDFGARVREYAEALNRSTEATRQFAQAQASVQAISESLGNAMDRLGQGIVDAFLSGSRSAINFGNLARSILGSLLTDFAKLAFVNPLRNSLFGSTSPTLSLGLGILGGGGGAANDNASGGGLGGIFNGLSGALNIGKLTDMLGLTNLGGQFSGLLNSIGLTGNGGLFSGISSGINSFLGTTLFEGPAGSLAAAAGAEFGPALGAAAGSPISIGSILGPAGIGFGLGSLGGGFLQSALGKVGPAPTIGSGVGTLAGLAAIPLLGPLGPILGGLLGGLGGGFIGPKPASPFSSTGVNVSDGLLSVGQTISQITDTSGELKALQDQVSALNNFLMANNVRIANGASTDNYGQNRLIDATSGQWLQIGQNSPNGSDPSKYADLNAAFSGLRFSANDNDVLSRALSGKSFGTSQDLANVVGEVTSFVNTVVPELLKLGSDTKVGSLSAVMQGVSDQFAAAIAKAHELGYAEDELTKARDKAVYAAGTAAQEAVRQYDLSLYKRGALASAQLSGTPEAMRDAQLYVFDVEAQKQREDLQKQLTDLYGSNDNSVVTNELLHLEDVLGKERLAIAKQYADQIAATEQAGKDRATASVTSLIGQITNYARSIQTGANSPLDPRAQYELASVQFNKTLSGVRAGDMSAMQNLTTNAETFRQASRALYGSGAGYASDFSQIVDALNGVAETPQSALTASAFAQISQSNTQTMVAALGDLRTVLVSIREAIATQSYGPPADRAAA